MLPGMTNQLSGVGAGSDANLAKFLTSTYVASANTGTAANPVTYSGIAIGTADTTRYVLVGFILTSAGSTITGATIGGVTATVSYVALPVSKVNYILGWAYAAVPTGTTATVAISGSSNMSGRIFTYAIYGKSSLSLYSSNANTSFTASPFTNTLNVPTNGFVANIAFFNTNNTYTYSGTAGITATSLQTNTWSGNTTVRVGTGFDLPGNAGTGQTVIGTLSGATTTAGSSISIAPP